MEHSEVSVLHKTANRAWAPSPFRLASGSRLAPRARHLWTILVDSMGGGYRHRHAPAGAFTAFALA
jgi:hypothetical protein